MEARGGWGTTERTWPRLCIEAPTGPGIAELFAASDAYSDALYPAESNHPVTAAHIAASGAVFYAARAQDGAAVGCGAIFCKPDGEAEIKRMWVEPAARGSGLGRRLLDALLTAAAERGVRIVRLETGTRQPAALALYRSAGFVERGPFGSYVEDPNSVFMERALG